MIKKYRRKEYIISAVRWLGEENCEEVFAFLGLEHPDDELDHTQIHFGTDTAEIGDWIVADGKRAGHSVCKDIWFRAMFEEEEPGPTAEDIVESHRLALSFVGTEFVRQADQPDQPGLDAFEADLAETEDGIDRMMAEAEPIVEPYCDGFPDTCPNKIKVAPAPPHHGGGIRCGCYDDGSLVKHVADALQRHGMVHLNDPELTNEYDCCAEVAIAAFEADLASKTSPKADSNDDTLPQWLYQRFACPGQPTARIAWDLLDDNIRTYWKHTAAAVRRAVARGGFKEQS